MKKIKILAMALILSLSLSTISMAENLNSSKNSNPDYIKKEELNYNKILKVYMNKDGEYLELSKEDLKNLLKENSKIKGKKVTTGLFNYRNMSLEENYSDLKRYTPLFTNDSTQEQKVGLKKSINLKGENHSLITKDIVKRSFNKKLAKEVKLDIDVLANVKSNKVCGIYISNLNYIVTGDVICEGIGGGDVFVKNKIKCTFPSKNNVLIFVIDNDF